MVALPKPQKFTSRLASIQKVSSKVYLKRFELVGPKEITFLPGQTVMLQVASGVNRSMSIASAPVEKTSILVAHDVSPMGPYSQWTINARVGDTMSFVGPLGMFVLDRESPRKRVFVATGTGVSPFRSMLWDLSLRSASRRRSNLSSEAIATSPTAPRNDITLYWGLRREEDIFWKEEFEELAAKHPNFRFVLTLSQPSVAWPGKRGRVGDHVFAEEKNLLDCDVYLCGSKAMVTEMEAALLAKGVPKEQIKKELFY
ncbi:hypothetical protein HY950_02730 [Candidatus Gottesmanbacteria bacterium]|nr:hypothetical protein [Candidatus Gottesmanbacteria bacterium]